MSNTNDYEAVPMDENINAPLNASRQTARLSATPSRSFNACSIIYLVLAAIFLVLILVLSSSPLTSAFFLFLALLPAVVCVYLIVKKLPDASLSPSFLVIQFFLGALPLVFLVFFAEYFTTFILIIALVAPQSSELQPIFNALPQQEPGQKMSDEELQKLFQQIVNIIPKWKFFFALLFMAYVTAATIEEAGKWFAARRYRKIMIDQVIEARPPEIGYRAILASACMVATGFAATENIAYVVGGSISRGGVTWGNIGLALLRGVLAFPVHVGTQFYIATSAARYAIFHEQSKVFRAFLVAVLFHGTFDFVAFGIGALVGLGKIPDWFNALVVVFDIVLVLVLLRLCTNQFRILKSKESALYSAV